MKENEADWNRLIKLGDMMGDGLHHEPGGSWISREYRKLSKILIPEIRDAEKERRRRKAEAVNKNMQRLTSEKKCPCGGSLKQSRSGSRICYCDVCGKRFKAVSKKR